MSNQNQNPGQQNQNPGQKPGQQQGGGQKPGQQQQDPSRQGEPRSADRSAARDRERKHGKPRRKAGLFFAWRRRRGRLR